MIDLVATFDRRQRRREHLIGLAILGFFGLVIYLSIRSDTYEVVETVPRDFCGELVKIYEVEPGDLSYKEDQVHILFRIEPRKISFRHERSTEWYSSPVRKVHLHSDSKIIVFYKQEGLSFDLRFQIAKRSVNIFVIHSVEVNLSGEDAFILEGYYQDPSDRKVFSEFTP